MGDINGKGSDDVAIAPYSYRVDIQYYRNIGTSSWTRDDVVY
jgi:hypothetical protein